MAPRRLRGPCNKALQEFLVVITLLIMAKKKMGRPPLAAGMAKKVLYQLRLTTAERKDYEQAAARAGIKLSAWIRDRLDRAAKRESK